MSQDSANDDPPKETAAGVDVAANAVVDVLDLSTIIDQNPPLINFAIGGDGCDEGQTSKKETDGGGGAKETGDGDEKKPSTSSVEEELSVMDVAKTSVKDAYLPERSNALEEDAPTPKKRGRGRPPGSKNRSAAAGSSLAVNADQNVQVGAGKPTTTGTADADVPQKTNADPTAMDVDAAEPSVRKSERARTPAPKPAAAKQDGKSTSNAARKKAGEAQDLYRQIRKSRDKLFFIAYSHHQDPAVAKGTQSSKAKEQWYLVRVDLSTCRELDSTKDCQKTGMYYVEFYTKASYGE